MLGILARLAPKYPIGFAPGFSVHARLVCRARKLEVNPKGTIGCLCRPTRAFGIRLVSNRYPIFPVLRPGEAGLLLLQFHTGYSIGFCFLFGMSSFPFTAASPPVFARNCFFPFVPSIFTSASGRLRFASDVQNHGSLNNRADHHPVR